MTTNTPTTASQAEAVSVEHDDEFNRLLSADEAAATDAHICGGDFGTQRTLVTAYSELVDYIDTKIAKAEARATAAEAQLDAIREGIKLLQQYWVWDGHLCETQNQHPERAVVRLDKVLALLTPQGQATDTSGLPG